MNLMADQSDHDLREDIAAELMTVSELLANEDNAEASRKAWTDAARVVTGEVSLDRGNELLCSYENQLGGI